MQIIIISSKNLAHTHWNLTLRHLIMLIAFLMVIVFISIKLSWDLQKDEKITQPINHTSLVAPAQQVSQLENSTPVTTNSEDINNYYAQRLGKLQAESIRLKAIIKRVAKVANIDISVFNLDQQPAQGGIDQEGDVLSDVNFHNEFDVLSDDFKVQDKQLSLLEYFYTTSNSILSAIPHGYPIKKNKGWLSSRYGYRIDPFTGKKAFHHGMDFAGKLGSDVVAVADGIVSWTGKRHGYGQMIDIDHGNGYVTRYAHNEKLIVRVGDRVTKGQTIALMGSTGRSTGPHVHFEVLLDGKMLDPYTFVKG